MVRNMKKIITLLILLSAFIISCGKKVKVDKSKCLNPAELNQMLNEYYSKIGGGPYPNPISLDENYDMLIKSYFVVVTGQVQPKQFTKIELLQMQIESELENERLRIENEAQNEIIKGLNGDLQPYQIEDIINRVVRVGGGNYGNRYNEIYRHNTSPLWLFALSWQAIGYAWRQTSDTTRVRTSGTSVRRDLCGHRRRAYI